MRMSENRYAKELRRRNLAKRMIEYEARTNTIVLWTGLTKFASPGVVYEGVF